MKKKVNTRAMAFTSVAAALAFLLQLLGSIVGLKVGGFLEIEFSDIPPLIVSFAYGPVFGAAAELVKNLLHCPFTSTGFVGELSNFFVHGVFVGVAGMIYQKNRTRRGALLGMSVGVVVMTAMAIASNLWIMLPMYMPSSDMHTRMTLVLNIITPFNICKGVGISLITFLLYKRLSPILKSKRLK